MLAGCVFWTHAVRCHYFFLFLCFINTRLSAVSDVTKNSKMFGQVWFTITVNKTINIIPEKTDHSLSNAV